MELTKQLKSKIKCALEIEHGRPFSDEEVEKVGDFLTGLAELHIEVLLEDEDRQRRLTASPGGFHLEKDGYCCRLCNGSAFGKDSWFDEHGLKCWSCQQAITQKIIPPSAATDRDSWYSSHELEACFGLTAKARRKWIKNGVLIARSITRPGNRSDFELFLIGDNASFLPPKALVQSRTVREAIDGQEWHSSRP
jgi:hypothetical protein